MSNLNQIKIIYTLKLHAALQLRGFKYLGVMPNPHNEKLSC